ncbi:unnamed protein product, partial [Polarella glacialis]
MAAFGSALITCHRDGVEEKRETGALMVHMKHIFHVKRKRQKLQGNLAEAPELTEETTVRLRFLDGEIATVQLSDALVASSFLVECTVFWTAAEKQKSTSSSTSKLASSDSALAPSKMYRRSLQDDEFGGMSANNSLTPNSAWMGKMEASGDSRDSKKRSIDSKVVTTTPDKMGRFGNSGAMRRAPAPRSSLLAAPFGGARAAAPQDSSSYGGYRSSFSFGLQNLGNTCYLNAVTQALCSLREFVVDLSAMPQALPACESGSLFTRTVEILKQMNTPGGTAGPLSPARLREQIALASPMFRGHGQQDAHEFLLEYVNQLHDELLVARK